MQDQNQNKEQLQNEIIKVPQKRSRKNKADGSKVSKTSHMTRRRQQPDSSQQNLLPAQIPQSSGTQSIITQGQQNQLSKILIRIPHTLFITQKFQSINNLNIQNNLILIKVQKQADNVTISARMSQIDKKMQVEEDKQKIVQNVQKIDQSSQSSEIEKNYVVNFWGKFVYLSNFQSQNKVIKKIRKQLNSREDGQIIKFKVKSVNSDLFVYLNIRAQQFLNQDFNGLVNQGNTCYMNSYLQTLYHIPAFRNLVYEAQIQDQTKFPATLQDLFFNLANSQKSVSPQALVKSFGWGKKQASIQQDAQQFSCLFFEVLQRKLNQSAPKNGYYNKPIHKLFKGQLNHYIRCSHVDFRRENYQEFIDLQLPIYPTLAQSLDAYTTQVHMEGQNMYRTEEYGQQQAFKGVKVSHFPPILMIQLKRFQYSFQQQRNIKILTQLQYQQYFDFAPWSLSQFKQEYQLYAVLVHQGAKAQSGHYYNFIKSQGKWYKFNDQNVQEVPREKVFKYNFGGFHESIQFDSKEMKVQKKMVESKTTAYMLVYIRCDMKQEIMKDNIIYPEWIKQKQSYKVQLEQMKKNRKKFFHNIGLIDWQKLHGQPASDIGFLDQELLKNKEIIPQISKASKISDWLYQQKIIDAPMVKDDKKSKKFKNSKKIKNSMLDSQQAIQIGIYIYYVTQRQHLTGFYHRPHHTMEDLLKIGQDPYIFKAPYQAKKQQYILIVKKYKVQYNGQETKPDIKYWDVIIIPKQISYPDLLNILKSRYQNNQIKQGESNYQQDSAKLKTNYYIDDLKFGPVDISLYQGNIPHQIPQKNQLLVCVIEQIPYSFNKQQQRLNFSFEKWYLNKKQTIILTICQQKTYDFIQLQQIHINLPLSQLRKIIFNLIKDKNPQIISPQNIVIKARLKKTSKMMFQASQPQCNSVKDLIKFQNRLQYCFSTLTIQSRQSQFQLIVHYQYKDLQFSDPIRIIVNKQQQSLKLVDRIKNHPFILNYLQKEGFQKDQSQIILFSKDRKVINDYVNNQGKVIHKGDLDGVIKKQKNSLIIVTGRNILKMENQPKIQIKQQDVDPMVYILLHHVSQSIQRVGQPRHFKVDRRMEFSQLKNKILDIIKDEVYNWENKAVMCNPFKTRIRLYAKDNKKVIELNQYEPQPQMRKLRIQDKSQNRGKNSRKSSLISNDGIVNSQTLKSPSQIIKSPIQLVTQPSPLVVQDLQIQKETQQKIDVSIQNNNVQIKLNGQTMKNDRNSDEEIVQKEEQNQVDQIIDEQQITNVSEACSTIYSIFPKIKVLKIQIIHNQLIKPNIALKLNVDF